MIYVDIISGFQGAGKSTLILRLLATVYAHETAALMENELGKVRLSQRAVRDARGAATSGSGVSDAATSESGVSGSDVSVTEIPAGCICCSRSDMLEQTITDIFRRGTFGRILLEPSGTAKLTDLLPLVQRLLPDEAQIHHVVSVVDVCSFEQRMLLSEDFFEAQLRNSPLVFLSKTELLPPEETEQVRRQILSIAPDCHILQPDLSDWDRAAPVTEPLAAYSVPALSRYRSAAKQTAVPGPGGAMKHTAMPGPGRR